jgi:3-methyladenine DNA glycosylase/8-oxoguanine DNA glycosylase
MINILSRQPALVAELQALGPFDLGESIRFLQGFAPASREDEEVEPGVLRLAFPVGGSWKHAGAVVRQRSPGSVEVRVHAPAEVAPDALVQVRRILSLDVDGAGFAELGAADPVLRRLQESYPGLRPVLFHSPYEAACWAIIGHRIRMTQAARIKRQIAEENGQVVEVDGRRLISFPDPEALLAAEPHSGLPMAKAAQLNAIAAAAADGRLDAESLRAMSAAQAQAQLQRLPGIGPFFAQLILIRGVGHPDVFPGDEPRLHAEMRRAYHLDGAGGSRLEEIAEGWRPYRSWAALLLRIDRERRTGESRRAGS